MNKKSYVTEQIGKKISCWQSYFSVFYRTSLNFVALKSMQKEAFLQTIYKLIISHDVNVWDWLGADG